MSRANGFFSTESVAGSALFAASRAWITGNSNSPNRIGKWILSGLKTIQLLMTKGDGGSEGETLIIVFSHMSVHFYIC